MNNNNDANKSFWPLLIAAAGMISTSIYLTAHYLDTHFPQGLGASYFCNFSSFFSCDAASNSPLSNIWGIPISFMGILIAILLLIRLFTQLPLKGVVHAVIHLNSLGCLALFLYSLAIMGHLCPACFVYYLFSWLASIVLWKNKASLAIEWNFFAIWALLFTIASGAMKYYTLSRAEGVKLLAPALIKEYDSNKNLGRPPVDSPYRILSATPNFADAPIRITIFSDFQCPACAMLSKVLHGLEARYAGKINAQYFFYPLDDSCNSSMQRPLHTLACQAAYLASCFNEEFATVHDLIFAQEHNLSGKWLNDYAKKAGVEKCYHADETRNKVVKMIETAFKFNIRSTPTILLNGVKIEGVLPLAQFYILLDELLRRHEEKK